MTYFLFLLQVIIISFSGVMAPGPMLTATVAHGVRSPHAGLLISIGHGIIEVPLMIALAFGVGSFLEDAIVSRFIFVLGGLFLAMMGFRLVRAKPAPELVCPHDAQRATNRRLTVVGAMMSLLNPYFLVWWATVGLALITRALEFGLIAFILFILIHWSCDALWYAFLGRLAYTGGSSFGVRFQKTAFLICGISLLVCAAMFIYSGCKPAIQSFASA